MANTTNEKLRAVFLAVLMVVSVFGTTVVLSGSAVAATNAQGGGQYGTLSSAQALSSGTVNETVNYNGYTTAYTVENVSINGNSNAFYVELPEEIVQAGSVTLDSATLVSESGTLQESVSSSPVDGPDNDSVNEHLEVTTNDDGNSSEAYENVSVQFTFDFTAPRVDGNTNFAFNATVIPDSGANVTSQSYATLTVNDPDGDAAPQLQSAETVSTQDDLDIEQINASFNETLDPSTVDAGDFNVTNPSATVNDVMMAPGDNSTVLLNVSNLSVVDATPNVSTTAGTISDDSGEMNLGNEVTATDGVSPVGSGFIIMPNSSVKEYDPGDGDEGTIHIAYEYAEDASNTDTVQVTLNGSGTTGDMANATVNESQYVDNGTLKSFVLDIEEDFNNAYSLSDGRYNVTVTVTDTAGNTLQETTSAEQVLINNREDSPSVNVQDVSSSVNGTDVTVNVTYSGSVTDVDSENLSEATIEFDGELKYTVYDEGTESYDTKYISISNTTTNSSVVSGVTDVETFSLNLASQIPSDAVEASFQLYEGEVTVEDDGAYSTIGGSQSADDTDFVNEGWKTLIQSNYSAPTIESVETDVGRDTASITFSRPVVPTDGSLDADEFAYQSDDNTTGATIIKDVYFTNDRTVVFVQFDNDVAADDIGADLISAQEGELLNPESGLEVSASETATLEDNTDPAWDKNVTTDGDLTTANEESYNVTVDFNDTANEQVNVEVSVAGQSINTTRTVDLESGNANEVPFSLNLSAVDTNTFDVVVEVTDAAGNGPVTTTVPVTPERPVIESAAVDPNNNSKVMVTFDEAVTAADGSNVGASNITYVDANGQYGGTVVNVSQRLNDTVVLTLDSAVDGDDLGTDYVEVGAGEVVDSVGIESQQHTATLTEYTDPDNIAVEAPSNRTVKQSDDTLGVTYTYTENVPNNTDTVNVTLTSRAVADNGSDGNVTGTVVFLIDDSGSMSDDITTVQDELGAFASQIGTENESVEFAILTFADGLQEVQSPTTNVTEVENSLDSIQTGGGTELNYDAINATLNESYFSTSGAPVIIDLTDENSDTRTETPTQQELSDELNATSATYIAVSNDANGQYEPKTLAEMTARGSWYDIQQFDADLLLQEIAFEVSESLGRSYTVQVDDTGFVDRGATKAVTLDLSELTESGTVPDGEYYLRITATDAQGNEATNATEDRRVVIDDEAPEVTLESINKTTMLAPGEDVNVTYTLSDVTNVSDVEILLTGEQGTTVALPISGSFDTNGTTEYTRTVTIPSQLADNAAYQVSMTATDESGHQASSETTMIALNSARPEVDHVEANIGEDTVTVLFSEPVTAADGHLSADDFAYQDVNGGAASAIESVRRLNDSAVELTLDAEVGIGALGADLVSVRRNAIHDHAPIAPVERYVSSGETTALSDTTAPRAPTIMPQSGLISPNNEGNYSITIDTHSERTNVSLTVTDGNRTISNTSTSGGNIGQADILFLIDESGSMSDEISTVRSELQAFANEVGGPGSDVQFGVVTFEGSVRTVQPLTGNVTEVENAIDSIVLTGGTEYNYDAVNDTAAGTQVSLRSDAGTVLIDLTDEDSDTQSGTPSQGEIADRLNATDTTYIAVSPDRTGTLEKKTLAKRTADGSWFDIQTFNSSVLVNDISTTVERSLGANGVEGEVTFTVNASALDDGPVQISANLTDLAPTPHSTESTLTVTKGTEPPLETTVSGDTLTVNVTTDGTLANALDGRTVTVSEHGPVESTTAAMYDQESQFTLDLSAGDFTQADADTYTATVTVPEDGVYHVEAMLDQDGDTYGFANQAIVDTADPQPTDAVIVNTDGSTTVISVLFNEPADTTGASVSIDGVPASAIVDTQQQGPNRLAVVVDQRLETGDDPNVTVTGGTEIYGDGQADPIAGSTTVHTIELQLDTGTNFVSVPAQTGTVELSTLDLSNVSVVWTYEDGEWTNFEPGESNNDFTTLEGGQGYIFEMDAPDRISVNTHNTFDGAGFGVPNEQRLDQGWNLVGHYQETPQSTTVALSSLGSDRADVAGSVHLMLAHSGSGYAYEASPSEMEPGEAYWVFITTDEEVYTTTPLGSEPGFQQPARIEGPA